MSKTYPLWIDQDGASEDEALLWKSTKWTPGNASPAAVAAQERQGFVNRTDSTISRTDSVPARTFTIQPAVTSYDFYVLNKKFTKSAPLTKVWTNVEGMHYFYFDETGTLQVTTTFSYDLIQKYALVALLYWDATNSVSILFGDERHGISMAGRTHLYLHETRGAVWESGLLITLAAAADSSGNNNTSAQWSISDGVIWDEDIVHNIVDGSPQTLRPTAQIPINYRLGVNGDWRKVTADSFPLLYTGKPAGYVGTRIPYNQYTGATWQLTEASSNGNLVLMHFFATNNVDEPVVGIVGQNEYSTIVAAREGALTELSSLLFGSIPTPELMPIATVIFETNSGYANTPKARIRSTDNGDDYIDWRSKQVPGGGGGSGGANGGLSLAFGSSMGAGDVNKYFQPHGIANGGKFNALTEESEVACPISGNIIALAWRCQGAVTNDQIQIYVNGISAGAAGLLTLNGASGVVYCSSPIPITAGDTVALRYVTAGGGAAMNKSVQELFVRGN